jgi:phage baseplate assembly protein V
VSEYQKQLDRLYRRVLMMVAPVRITATDDKGVILTAQVGVSKTPEIIDKVPVIQSYGLHVNPPPNSDAVAIFHAGQRSSPVVIGSNHQKSRPKDKKPGEVMLYTDEGDQIVLGRDHKMSAKTKEYTLNAETSVEIDSKNVTIKGTGEESTIKLDSPNVTVTHKLTLAQDPLANLEAATKQYVDMHVRELANTLSRHRDSIERLERLIEAPRRE